MSKRWLGCIVLVIVGWSSTALANLTSGTVDVGDVVVDATTPTKDGTATSDGSDLLDHFTLTGAGCPRFSITATLPQLITVATPMNFTVHFAPLARGTLTCTVSFRDAANANIGTDFTIQGKGVAQQISAPASVAFGSVRVANAAVLTASQVITIGNNGDAGHDLSITNLAISGSSDFTITAQPSLPATVAATGSITVTVQFNPSAAGLENASLDITSDDPITPNKSVPLSGTGTNAVIAVSDVAFGVVNLTATKILTTAVTNAAASNPGTLKIASATINDPSGVFTFDTDGFSCLGLQACTFGAAPGITAPQNIGIRCTPTATSTGVLTATVSFTSDSDSGGDNVASLSCTAGRADISVDQPTLAYGNVDVGATVVKTITVTNTDAAPNIDLVFTASKIGARAGEYTFGGCFSSCAVPAGTSKQFTVSFTPTARSATAGSANITINLASNDPDDANLPIPVTATSIAPVITAPASVAYGNVEVVTTSTKTLTITNSGDDDLVITSANFTLNDGSYAITSGVTGAQTVTAGNTAAWDITCTPATAAAHNGTFTIASNALGAASKAVPLTCTGTEGILVVIPTSINFGGVAQHTVSTINYKLHNSGNLVVNNITATLGGTGTAYTFATPPTSLQPGAANDVTLSVTFSPLTGADGGPATLTFAGTWGATNKPLRVPPVLAIDGDGLTTGFDVAPNTVDFGDLRFDTTVSKTFCIQNTSQAPVTIQSPLAITPGAGTSSGEFTANATVKRQATCGVGGVNQTLPQTLAATEVLEVTVVADPANRIGAMNATLTVTSNLAAPDTTRTVTLVGNSTTAALTLAPGSTVDFGAQDIQAGPVTQNITITNTGGAPLDLKSFARSDAGNLNPHFTFLLPPNTTLAPGMPLTIPVTYAPTVVSMPAESITLSNTIAGVLGGPANQMIVITGRGIDREIQLAAPPVFPDTFRNPGDAAPVGVVTVMNKGEAILHITTTMLTTADPTVWTLLDGGSVDIPGLGSRDFHVRFAPNTIGTAPPATLELTNDDSNEMMASEMLTGNGIGRNVAFGSRELDLGFTGIGVPVTLDDALVVTSMDPTNGFTITDIALDGDAVFAIEGSTQNITLPAAGTHSFAVTFTPEMEGEFHATAHLFLDTDLTSTADIPIRGNAVFVDAHGGGGCSTGGDASGGAIVLIAFAIIALRRRGASVLVLALAAIPAARADNNVVLSVFDPTPATTGTGFQLQSPEVGHNGDWVLSATGSYATKPLIESAFQNGKFLNDDRVVDRSTLLERRRRVRVPRSLRGRRANADLHAGWPARHRPDDDVHDEAGDRHRDRRPRAAREGAAPARRRLRDGRRAPADVADRNRWRVHRARQAVGAAAAARPAHTRYAVAADHVVGERRWRAALEGGVREPRARQRRGVGARAVGAGARSAVARRRGVRRASCRRARRPRWATRRRCRRSSGSPGVRYYARSSVHARARGRARLDERRSARRRCAA